MDKRSYGLTLVIAGFSFLTLSFLAPAPSIVWGVSIAASILFNIAGTANLMDFINEKTEEENNIN